MSIFVPFIIYRYMNIDVCINMCIYEREREHNRGLVKDSIQYLFFFPFETQNIAFV